ncbi:MAG: putative drug exporter of the superfamily, partial [Acidimicrobiaceae bacterium]
MSLAGLSRWCYRRRRTVVGLWIVGFIVLNVIGGVVGDAYSDNFSGGKSDSIDAFNLLKERFPARAGDTADIVFTAPQGVTSPEVRTAMEGLFAEVGPGKVPHEVALDSPYLGIGRINDNGTIAYATATFDQQAGDLPPKTAQPLIDAAKKVNVPGLRIEFGGAVTARALEQSPGGAEGIGLLAAIVILFIAFGSLLAMSLPVLAAIFGVGIGSVFV